VYILLYLLNCSYYPYLKQAANGKLHQNLVLIHFRIDVQLTALLTYM